MFSILPYQDTVTSLFIVATDLWYKQEFEKLLIMKGCCVQTM
jgi:hypothetical protein